MSLIRLLAAGSSIRGIKDQRSPYKMTQQHLLPKFGSTKDPEPQASAMSALPAPARVLPAKDSELPVELLTQNKQTQMTVVKEDASRAPRLMGSARVAGTPFWRWAQSKNPFRSKPAPRKRVGPLQGELLLEGVKVVRNDLNEADLEVISAVPPSETPKRHAGPDATAETPRPAWGRIATRLFGERRT